MFIVVTYDVAARRTELFRKTLTRYLQHEQNSVFAGKITEVLYRKLLADLQKRLEPTDRVMVFRTENRRNITVETVEKSEGNGSLLIRGVLSHETDSAVI